METEYRIAFVDDAHNVMSETTVAVPGHREACNAALRLMPLGATDFRVSDCGEAEAN